MAATSDAPKSLEELKGLLKHDKKVKVAGEQSYLLIMLSALSDVLVELRHRW